MNRFLGSFLLEAPAKLSEVRREIQALRELNTPDKTQTRQILRKIFQQIHTLKGSSSAFGIESVSALAHEIENLLDRFRREEIACDKKALNALESGIEKIEVTLVALRKKDIPVLPHDVLVKIRGLTKKESKKNDAHNENQLPAEFLEKLNENEKENLHQSVADGASIFVMAVEFPIAEFHTKLQTLRAELEQNGEIIANLPGAFVSSASIALQIVFAAQIAEANVLKITKSFDGTILFSNQTEVPVAESFTTALFAGRRAATELGKEIEFEISGGHLKISKKQSNALATALLHLVTNAVAHGIESSEERVAKGKHRRGIVNITAQSKENSIFVSVGDDGRGIDFEKIMQTAGEILGTRIDARKKDLAQARNLLFTLGFSTAGTVIQVAGRGVGLDAAKSAVESVGGSIQVSSKLGQGTTFDVAFPLT